jgi:hypothetical protein
VHVLDDLARIHSTLVEIRLSDHVPGHRLDRAEQADKTSMPLKRRGNLFAGL